MRVSAGLLSFVIAIPLAQAHTPYLVPNAFEPINGGMITLDASFAEHFFIPEVVFDGSEFEVVLPDGSMTIPDTVDRLRMRAVVEHDMVEDGTYRFSTGRRLGRVFRMYMLDGERHAMEDPDAPLPEGAELVDFYQSNTMAETYVSRGAPNDGPLRPRGDGIEFVMQTHPNDLFVGEDMALQALFFSEPVAGLKVDVFLASRYAADDAPVMTLHSDSNGEFVFTPEAGGVYLLRARHRAPAPEGAAAPEFSNTYTLVVEAFE